MIDRPWLSSLISNPPWNVAVTAEPRAERLEESGSVAVMAGPLSVLEAVTDDMTVPGDDSKTPDVTEKGTIVGLPVGIEVVGLVGLLDVGFDVGDTVGLSVDDPRIFMTKAWVEAVFGFVAKPSHDVFV